MKYNVLCFMYGHYRTFIITTINKSFCGLNAKEMSGKLGIPN